MQKYFTVHPILIFILILILIMACQFAQRFFLDFMILLANFVRATYTAQCL